MNLVFELASPQCSAEEFDGEIVAINLDSGIYYSMKGMASLIWTALCDGHAVENILSALPSDTDIRQDVLSYIQELERNGLIRQTAAGALPKAELSSGFAALGPVDRPTLESFGDMQSLLLLDPVHEVDEGIGWPNLPEGCVGLDSGGI